MDVLKVVLDLQAEWMNFGIALGVRKSELDAFSKQYPVPKDCLRELLSAWLQGRCKRPPTWKTLCEAVQEPAGGNKPILAAEIAREHKVTLPSEEATPYMCTYAFNPFPACLFCC